MIRIKVNTGTRRTRAKLERQLASAAGLVKEVMGVANNAAWLICVDAYDRMRTLPNWKARHKGFRRALDEFKAYERRLIWDDNYRFFDLRDMPEATRKMYGDISNREYYEFWAAVGGSAYDRTKAFVSSLQNKYRLALLHNGVAEGTAVPLAWGSAAFACLNCAVEIYSTCLDTVANQFALPRGRMDACFHLFSLGTVSRLWGCALKDCDPVAFAGELSVTDGKNVQQGIEDIMLLWTDGPAIYDDMEKTLRECGEDVMRTKGCIRKAIAEVEGMREIHNQTE